MLLLDEHLRAADNQIRLVYIQESPTPLSQAALDIIVSIILTIRITLRLLVK